MKFKSHFAMRSCPEFKVDAKTNPIAFRTSIKGAFNCKVGAIALNIGEIPIRLTIPFLKGRERAPVAATIGGFGVKLNPFDISIDDLSLGLDGVLGCEGINTSMDCKVACKTEMDVVGVVSGKVAAAAFELEEEVLDGFEDACVKKN